ncbi:MAG: hypothetical protein L0L35_09005, partial [Enterococcus sp.]|nr:hypothetical protein [Enterococcus sp.]
TSYSITKAKYGRKAFKRESFSVLKESFPLAPATPFLFLIKNLLKKAAAFSAATSLVLFRFLAIK